MTMVSPWQQIGFQKLGNPKHDRGNIRWERCSWPQRPFSLGWVCPIVTTMTMVTGIIYKNTIRHHTALNELVYELGSWMCMEYRQQHHDMADRGRMMINQRIFLGSKFYRKIWYKSRASSVSRGSTRVANAPFWWRHIPYPTETIDSLARRNGETVVSGWRATFPVDRGMSHKPICKRIYSICKRTYNICYIICRCIYIYIYAYIWSNTYIYI